MSIETSTQFGGIQISSEAIAKIAGEAATNCYGIVGLAARGYIDDALCELLKIEDYVKGVYVAKHKDTYEVNIYIIVVYGVKVTEVVSEVQKRVSYVLEKTFHIPFKKVNVYVQDIKEIE